MLIQNKPKTEIGLSKFQADLSSGLINDLDSLQRTGIELNGQEENRVRIDEILKAATVLRAEMMCQKCSFYLTYAEVGEVFDEKRMEDVKMTDMDDLEKYGKVAIVSCVLSRGWVKSEGMNLVWISKSRVLVEIVDS